MGCCPVEYTPRRLVTVGLDEKPIRLVDGDAVTDQLGYATLSYCWGDSLNLCTTKETLSRLRQGIPVESLPQTFLDAINMAQSLGIPRIWIDALCIVQDDEEEWQTQAAEMSEIFQGSQLTITASQSSNSSEGCFPIGTGERIEDELIFRTKWFTTARIVHIHSSDIRRYGAWYGIVKTRGWALQEHILSPRVVCCFKSGIHWQCRACYRTQHGVFFDRDEVMDKNISERSPSLYPGLKNDRQGCHDTWRLIASDYTGRRFSHHQDIVPALAGITKYFASALEDIPLLGLWRETFVQDLAWVRVGERVRPHSSELPSWSWLSARGRIEYRLWNQEFYEKGGHASHDKHARFLGWDIQWHGTPHTSLVKTAEVKIHGPVRKIQIAPLRSGSECNLARFSVSGEAVSPLSWCFGQFDKGEITAVSTYLCLLLYSAPLHYAIGKVEETFLILEPVQLQNGLKYRRVGAALMIGEQRSFRIYQRTSICLI